MRMALAVLVAVLATAGAPAQEDKLAVRYGVHADVVGFPQDTPQNALRSVLKAADANRFKYLVAQLADPDWVDRRVQGAGGDFGELVKETTGKLAADKGALKVLRRFLTEGEWETTETGASARLKDTPDRVFFRKVEGRWFLENRKKPSP